MNFDINTILTFLILLPVSIAILNVWIWVFYNIFNIKKEKKDIIKITIVLGIISGLSIVLYPKLVNFLNLNGLNFTNYEENLGNFNLIFFFWAYLGVIILATRLILKLKFTKFFITNFTIFSIIFLIGGYISNTFLTTGALIYYSFVALGEEFIKYMLGVNFFEKRKVSFNDIIIFSILSAIGFAFIENLVYLIGSIGGEKNIVIGLIGGSSLILTRGIIGFLVHIIFTGNIGQFSKEIGKKSILYLGLGIILGVSLHYFYNMLLDKGYQIVILFMLILGYFWISYLFYSSHAIYVEEGLNT